jgi:hypothetical protein
LLFLQEGVYSCMRAIFPISGRYVL